MTTIRSTANRSDVEAALNGIVGEPCWAIIAGPDTGSVILLDLGGKLPRDRELSNPTLTEDERRFEAPYSIHVWCSWRVEERGRVVGSSMAMSEDDWWRRSGLGHIRDRRLTGFELGSPVPDLRLQFGESALVMFADTLSEDEEDCAYTVRTSNEVLVVFASGELLSERVEC